MTTRRWPPVLAYVLLVVGPVMFFINAGAVLNGNAVECDGSPMRPGQWCSSFSGGGSVSYDEEKKNEARGELLGYAGVSLAALGIVVSAGHSVAARRRRR